jgi:hypothetical protein
MGLDMYLTRKTYIGGNYEHRNVKGSIDISINGKKLNLDLSKLSEVTEQVGYWRKANAIHKWFVDNVQGGADDCREYHVSQEQLQTLLDLCKKVKKVAKLKKGAITNGRTIIGGAWVPIAEEGKEIVNAEKIHDLLPTSSGFFFGSTDYDEYYMQDIDSTIEILDRVIKESEESSGEIYYESSW